MAPVDMSLPCVQIIIDPADLGWLGTARHVRIPDDARVRAAIVRRAAELGVEIADISACGTSASVIITTGTAKTWLDADKLVAYMEGLADGLTGDYGNAPVEVGRKDLRALLSASAASWLMVNPELSAALERLQAALDGTVSDGQPVGT